MSATEAAAPDKSGGEAPSADLAALARGGRGDHQLVLVTSGRLHQGGRLGVLQHVAHRAQAQGVGLAHHVVAGEDQDRKSVV